MTEQNRVLHELLVAADPFVRACNIIDTLPAHFAVPDSRPLYDCLPGVWPTMGELRALEAAIRKVQILISNDQH
jgi:hypothetical protein